MAASAAFLAMLLFAKNFGLKSSTAIWSKALTTRLAHLRAAHAPLPLQVAERLIAGPQAVRVTERHCHTSIGPQTNETHVCLPTLGLSLPALKYGAPRPRPHYCEAQVEYPGLRGVSWAAPQRSRHRAGGDPHTFPDIAGYSPGVVSRDAIPHSGRW